MLTFTQHLSESTAERDRHLTHIEDRVLTGGVAGTRDALQYLIALRNMFADGPKELAEMTSGNYILRTKFDGAPAVYAGINPENGRFFVGSKSIFAKGAKLNYTQADIQANHSGGLAEKLSLCLQYLPALGIKGIVHGDFMFAYNDLKSETIEGRRYITFRPNTIMYAVPEGTPLAAEIQAAKIGIVFHTTYMGTSMTNLKTYFDVDINSFRKSRYVWYRENSFTNVGGKANLTPAEERSLSSYLSQAGSLFRSIPAPLLNEISSNNTYQMLIMTYHNQRIREGQQIGNVAAYMKGLIQFVSDRYQKNVDAAKMAKTKQNKLAEKNLIVSWFRRNAAGLKQVFKLQDLIISAKTIIVTKLHQVQDIGTFISDGNGFRVTNHEGFVLANMTSGSAVKLIDRLTFSRENFTAQKNWSK